MSWSSPVRVLGVCGVWLAIQTGCGGNPSVSDNDPGTNGGTSTGANGNAGKGGGLDINTGGDNDNTGGDENPTTYVCGNGELEPGEFCDDGNVVDDDGCSGDCTTVDPDFDCSAVGETCVQVVVCGNGVIEGDEVCDDMNQADADGCAADCKTVEPGWACVRPGQPCVVLPVCGNGVRERGERCDDGGTCEVGSNADAACTADAECPGGACVAKANDGCDTLCLLEAGYQCPTPGMKCSQIVCGDGVLTRDEGCDDGQDPPQAGDGCSATCTVETGWHCNSMGCKPQCGDGLVRGSEACDDGDALGGDGCSSGCKTEPFYKCTQADPSVCSPDTQCGNATLDPIFTRNAQNVLVITSWEKCDPPNVDGCNASCTDFDPEKVDPPQCGNNKVETGEDCDRGSTADPGCVACKVTKGYSCPPFGECTLIPICGDSTVDLALGETCDPPKTGKGCDKDCHVEPGWSCSGLGPSTCTQPVCGNGVVEVGEECDDKTNTGAADGCSGCKLGTGWYCPTPGAPCLAKCGDGIKLGTEQCDDGPSNRADGDGCNSGCKIEFGFKCPTAGQKCVATVCGDGAKNPAPLGTPDPGEGCDLGDTISGDGCSATCQVEPTVKVGTNPVVNVKCGDGLITSGEICDDGNTNDDDGCEGDCKSETPGWDCTPKVTLPKNLQMQVTYRDFKSNAATGGHPHFENVNDDNKGIAGDPCTTGNQATCGRLDSAGKPQSAGGFSSIPGGNGASTSAARFATWYRDTNTLGFTVSALKDTLPLQQVGAVTSDVYEYSSAAHFPLDGRGNGNTCGSEVSPDCCNAGGACVGHNFGFTTELRYFFQYKGGETLTFRGDDDVWVFINGRLAVDVGGVHCAEVGQVILGDEDSTCSLHGTDYTDNNPNGNFSSAACATTGDPPACALSAGEKTDTTDGRFGLTKGGVYEIVLFHAERHTSASNFKLTLAGFLAPRSSCETKCPDGVVAGDEVCDDNGSDPTQAGACNATCTAVAYCGDGIQQAANPSKNLPAEYCDNGTNGDLYQTASSQVNVCAPGCKRPAFCGDGAVQAGQGEKCDKGGANNDTSYGPGSCKTNCTPGGYCGDGDRQLANGESCDLGAGNGTSYGVDSCTYTCTPGPRCGDGQLAKGREDCDDGAKNGDADSSCSLDCKKKPRCGDGIKQGSEQCDYGQFASTEYGGCTSECVWGPMCGDGGPGNTPDHEEECDYGEAGNTGGYNGCTDKCALGPHCGDALVQANEGEACDNGFNADDYDDPDTTAAECGPGCTPPPFCGDKLLQKSYEECDDPNGNYPVGSADPKAYGGCTTKCEFGPFCGDGNVDGPEVCDDGLDNVGYSPTKDGCGYDCQIPPYCGDGERNGPEQCDLGDGKNTGDYGTCNADCTFAPRCGDKKKNGSEQCDDGPSGSLSCTSACKKRAVVQ